MGVEFVVSIVVFCYIFLCCYYSRLFCNHYIPGIVGYSVFQKASHGQTAFLFFVAKKVFFFFDRYFFNFYFVMQGTSTKYSPQRVGLQHVMADEDVIQIIKK